MCYRPHLSLSGNYCCNAVVAGPFIVELSQATFKPVQLDMNKLDAYLESKDKDKKQKRDWFRKYARHIIPPVQQLLEGWWAAINKFKGKRDVNSGVELISQVTQEALDRAVALIEQGKVSGK